MTPRQTRMRTFFNLADPLKSFDYEETITEVNLDTEPDLTDIHESQDQRNLYRGINTGDLHIDEDSENSCTDSDDNLEMLTIVRSGNVGIFNRERGDDLKTDPVRFETEDTGYTRKLTAFNQGTMTPLRKSAAFRRNNIYQNQRDLLAGQSHQAALDPNELTSAVRLWETSLKYSRQDGIDEEYDIKAGGIHMKTGAKMEISIESDEQHSTKHTSNPGSNTSGVLSIDATPVVGGNSLPTSSYRVKKPAEALFKRNFAKKNLAKYAIPDQVITRRDDPNLRKQW
eukprot:CAMPEP_0115000748 /NCGR_PEP_ID=MMETSP0216-20121206/16946_1 /TAXON_ID=223996 /ORGANISM="Protocruzia adherens, Strain Boccale" /LENGTH=283 /DNA_ID=CAMNT_0002365913 /DNA_START=1017 /DNA_END=1865 /DNA_ORIENTATION=+